MENFPSYCFSWQQTPAVSVNLEIICAKRINTFSGQCFAWITVHTTLVIMENICFDGWKIFFNFSKIRPRTRRHLPTSSLTSANTSAHLGPGIYHPVLREKRHFCPSKGDVLLIWSKSSALTNHILYRYQNVFLWIRFSAKNYWSSWPKKTGSPANFRTLFIVHTSRPNIGAAVVLNSAFYAGQ